MKRNTKNMNIYKDYYVSNTKIDNNITNIVSQMKVAKENNNKIKPSFYSLENKKQDEVGVIISKNKATEKIFDGIANIKEGVDIDIYNEEKKVKEWTIYTKAIYNSLCTLYKYVGIKRGFTSEELIYVLNGGRNTYYNARTPAQIEEIDREIQYLRSLWLFVKFGQDFAKKHNMILPDNNNSDTYKFISQYDDSFLSLSRYIIKSTDETGHNSYNTYMYQFTREPYLLEFAGFMKQIYKLPLKVFDVPKLFATKSVIALSHYMSNRIALMINHNNNVSSNLMLFDTIYSISTVSYKYNKSQRQLSERQKCYKILNHFCYIDVRGASFLQSYRIVVKRDNTRYYVTDDDGFDIFSAEHLLDEKKLKNAKAEIKKNKDVVYAIEIVDSRIKSLSNTKKKKA